jgi:uncharacterized protein YjbI with pentapeptide repeats
MDRRDSWSAYIHRIWQRARRHWLRWLSGFLGFAIFLAFLTSEPQVFPLWLDTAFTVFFLLTLFAPALRRGARWLSRGRYFAGSHATPSVIGATGLLTTLLLGLPLPLRLVSEGETLDRPAAYGVLMQWLRHLDVHEKALFANPARPEVLADLRSTDPAKREAALRSVERIDLQKRSLRGANLYRVLMPMADLREANLQGANLGHAQLQAASLILAQLQGATLVGAQLQAADLMSAKLQAADLGNAALQGANLQNAELQGAFLLKANFKGAKLRDATLYTNPIMMMGAVFELVDARGLKWRPLSAKEIQQLRREQTGWAWSTQNLSTHFSDRIRLAARPGYTPPQMVSCLRGPDLLGIYTQVTCKDAYALDEFRKRLVSELEQLACSSPHITRGLAWRFYNNAQFSNTIFDRQDSITTKGLMAHLKQRLTNVADKRLCPGLALLTSEDKQYLRGLAEWDESQRRGGSQEFLSDRIWYQWLTRGKATDNRKNKKEPESGANPGHDLP